jgi:hypothetical protein
MHLLVAVVFSLLLSLLSLQAIAQATGTGAAISSKAPAVYQGSANTSVSLTLYHALVTKSGKEYYMDNSGNKYPLPGAGTNDPKTVAVYSGSNGQRWYVDKTGQSVDLPPQGPPQAQPQMADSQPSNDDSSFQINGQNVDSSTPTNVTINNYNQAPADDSNDSDLAAGFGAAAGALLGAGLADAVDGIPYGYPLYAGAGGWAPYYWGADGYQHYLNRNLANQAYFHDWANNSHWYNGQVNTLGGRYYNQVQQARAAAAFDHPQNIVPHDFARGEVPADHVGAMDMHGFASIDDAGVEHSGDLLNQARGDFDRGNFDNRFANRGFGDHGFGDRGFGDHGFGGRFRGGGGGFHGGGRR